MSLRWWPLLALAAAGWPLAGWYVARLSEDPWHLAPLVAAAWILARRRHSAEPGAPPLSAAAMVALGAAAGLWCPPLIAATFLVAAAALVLCPACCGRRLQPGLAGLLLLALPTVPALQMVFGYPLRLASGAIAAALLRFGGVRAAHEGAILRVDGEPFAIDAPCSGISMWWTALVITAWLAARSGAGVARTLLGASLATALVVVGNGLRSASLVQLAASRLEAPGWIHEGVGLVAFTISAAAIVLIVGRTLEEPRWLAR